jgi:23S rRNA pseudouridine1911/1915/1917 synthase
METIFLTATPEEKGRRLDQFQAEQLEELTRSAAQRLLEEGKVTSGGKVLAKNYKLTGSETVDVELPEPEPIDVVPQDIPLDVVFEDSDVIVVNKPKGMVVHPAPGHPDGTLVNALLHHCGDSLSGIGGELRPGIVHRIDRDTTGLIIAAKNDFAHQKLAAQLQDHTLARVYHCIVIGNLREDSGTVDAPIGRHRTDRKKMAVVSDGRNAVTHWRVLERFQGYTYVECRLETGRTHQIRVHMASLGHPLLGDPVYGGDGTRFEARHRTLFAGQCLHAGELSLIHPVTEQPMTFKAPLPEAFAEVLARLRKEAEQ